MSSQIALQHRCSMSFRTAPQTKLRADAPKMTSQNVQYSKNTKNTTKKQTKTAVTIQYNAIYSSELQIHTGLDATLLHCQLDSFVTSPQVSQVNRMIAHQWAVRSTSGKINSLQTCLHVFAVEEELRKAKTDMKNCTVKG